MRGEREREKQRSIGDPHRALSTSFLFFISTSPASRASPTPSPSTRTGPDVLFLTPTTRQVLESFNYFSLSITLADYLTASFGASDVEAGSLYGAWGAALVGAGMALGPLIDAAGVRRSLLLSATVTALSRAALAIVTGRRAAIAILLVPVSLGGALGSPVLTIGVKRAAPERARGFVYSLLYAAMNAAAFFAVKEEEGMKECARARDT